MPRLAGVLHTQRITSSRQEVLPSGATRPSVWALLLQALHEALATLQREGAAGCVVPLLPEVVGCVRAMVAQMEEPSLLSSLLPLLLLLAAPEFAPALLPHFAELVDLLLGFLTWQRLVR